MDMGITYQAPTTVVKKIPAKPLATYTSSLTPSSSLANTGADEYGLPQATPQPSNRYNFDSLLGDDVRRFIYYNSSHPSICIFC
jgi:hypothetical protein